MGFRRSAVQVRPARPAMTRGSATRLSPRPSLLPKCCPPWPNWRLINLSIGPEHLKGKLVELLRGAESKPDGQVIAAFAQYISEHVSELTPEAQALVDKMWEALQPELEEVVQHLPDTIEGRQLKRLYARIVGKHWDAAGLIGGLETPAAPTHSVIAAARPLFEAHLQAYLDLLWDVAQHSHQGPAAVIRMAMLALCADEALVAFHLAQRGYASQALSHVRTVFEALNLVELFSRDPTQADLWASADEQTAWREFRPVKVRKKLARPGTPRSNLRLPFRARDPCNVEHDSEPNRHFEATVTRGTSCDRALGWWRTVRA